jgi:hypothetical protein
MDSTYAKKYTTLVCFHPWSTYNENIWDVFSIRERHIVMSYLFNFLIQIIFGSCFWNNFYTFLLKWNQHLCRNPTLAKCGGEAQHLEKVKSWSPPGLPNVQSSTARPKTPRIGVFLVSLERSWSVDIENGLALAIWTSVAQVMGKRRVGSQTDNLTPDH